jgi:aromatic ring-opening dioxygenase LigB subunit
MSSAAAAALGGRLADLDERVALLVMGDGSARRSEKAPGWFDHRAAAFDDAVAAALSAADVEALLRLDEGLARDLLAAGRAPWQVLAGAGSPSGLPWSAELLVNEAPFGVGYFVSSWTRAQLPSAGNGVGVGAG